MKWLNILSGLLFTPLFVVLLGGSYAKAASDWDPLFTSNHIGTPETVWTNNLIDQGASYDLTDIENLSDNPNRWIETFSQACNYGSNDFQVYENAMDLYNNDDYYYSLVNIYTGTQAMWTLRFYEKSTSQSKFYSTGSAFNYGVETTSNYYQYTFYISGDPQTNTVYDAGCSEYFGDFNKVQLQLISTGTNAKLYITNLDVFENAPPGFDPEILPEVEYVTDESDDVPGVRYYIKFAYDVSLAEGIKLTNEIPEDLTDNLPSGIWQCYFLITNDVENDEQETGIDQDIYNLDSCDDRTQIIHHPPVELAKVYLVELVLQNKIYQNDRLSASQRLEVTLNPYSGDTELGDDRNALEQCITDEAPYIDIFGCFDTLKYVINILSFGTFDFTGMFNWTFQPSCRELTIFDRWMNLEGQNRILCPMFSKEVRDTITPFVTIVFGTTILVMVVRTVSGMRQHRTAHGGGNGL